MACMARMSLLVVDLTFGEVYHVPQRALRSQPGLRPAPKKDLNHRGSQRKKKEDNRGDSLSVSSVVKNLTYAEGMP